MKDFWDWLMGTAYLPEGRKPRGYGLDDPFPQNIVTQQLHAFRAMPPEVLEPTKRHLPPPRSLEA